MQTGREGRVPMQYGFPTTRPALPAARSRPWLAALLAVGLFMMVLNLLTPMASDDYFYACRLTLLPDGTLFPAGKMTGIGDLLVSLKNIYIGHSGRLPVLFAAELSTLVPEWLFDLCNAAVFALLILALARMARPHSQTAAALTILGGGLVLWLATPAFGQNFLWQTGSVNYLWTMAVTMVFLNPFLHPGWMPRLRRRALLWFALGLLSGWSMENQSAAACFLCTARLVQLRVRRQPLPRLLLAGAAGQWLGFALLMTAPGNFHRGAGYGQAGFGLMQLPARAVQYTAALWTQLWWLILLALGASVWLLMAQHRQAEPALWLLAGAAVCHFSMAASPIFPLRSMLGTEVFLTAELLFCANRLFHRPRVPALICGALLLALAVQLPAGVTELMELRRNSDTRAAYIEDCRAAGQTELTVPILPAARTRFNLFWGDALSDLMQNPTNERNVALAYYYDVSLIRGDPDMTL